MKKQKRKNTEMNKEKKDIKISVIDVYVTRGCKKNYLIIHLKIAYFKGL